jgi:HSP20 family protein
MKNGTVRHLKKKQQIINQPLKCIAMTHVLFNRKPLEKSFTNLFDDFMTELPGMLKTEWNHSHGKGFAPVNITETKKAFLLEVAAPGFEKNDFKVNIEQDILTISAEKKEESKIENANTIRREYNYSSFKRSFTIDEKIDATNIEATYVNGILTLNLPRKEPVKASATEITIK